MHSTGACKEEHMVYKMAFMSCEYERDYEGTYIAHLSILSAEPTLTLSFKLASRNETLKK